MKNQPIFELTKAALTGLLSNTHNFPEGFNESDVPKRAVELAKETYAEFLKNETVADFNVSSVKHIQNLSLTIRTKNCICKYLADNYGLPFSHLLEHQITLISKKAFSLMRGAGKKTLSELESYCTINNIQLKD